MTKVLVIRFRRIGDAVLSSTVCSSLKQSIPNCEVHYVLNNNIAPLFDHHPDIDHIVTFSQHDMSNTIRYLRKVRKVMRKGRYDIIIDMRATVKTLPFSLFGLRAKYRIGYRKSYNPFIHSHRIRQGDTTKIDNVSLSLTLLNPLAKEYSIQKVHDFRLYCSPEEKADYRNYLQSKGVDFSRPIIACAVSARLEHKVWPLDYMRQVLQQTLDKYDAQLIFNRGNDIREKEQAAELHKMLGNDSRVYTNIEADNLRKLLAMMANAAFFFGNEGGPRHIAQALRIPSLAIYPPGTSITSWLPNRSERYQGIEPSDVDPNIASSKEVSYKEKFLLITPSIVWNSLDKMLSNYLW